MDRTANVLLDFSRLVAAAAERSALLPLLAEASVELAGADAALVLEVTQQGTLAVTAGRGVPEGLLSWVTEAETIGYELEEQAKQACGGVFHQACVRPMVSSGGLFGALILLFRNEQPLPDELVMVADGLVDLTATALNRAAQMDELLRAHAELKASQETLVRTERLRALGEMAAGIAHDLKNILNPMSLYLQLIQRSAARGDQAAVQEKIDAAKGIIQRGTETLERLRDFSRQSVERDVEIVDLNHLAHEAAELARPRLGTQSGRLNTLKEELGEPPRVAARAGEVVSALLNVIVNAVDAMPHGGKIVLRTSAVRDGALVEVVDTGSGMPKEVVDRVFEPFFTTKGESGTGLGLAMVHSCVQRYGGSVSIDTAPGKGTTVGLWFPKAAPLRLVNLR